MKSGTAMIWPILCGACLFYLGYLTHGFTTPNQEKTSLTYLENLTKTLKLSDTQHTGVRNLLDEEDMRIQDVLKGEDSKKLWRIIDEIRKEISTSIKELLDEDQKKLFEPIPNRKDLIEQVK